MTHEVAVIGAGVSALALARHLANRGRQVVVLERSRGVGGRCATRRIEGQPVDHGVAYLHGRSERFLAELDAVAGGQIIPEWPRVREGSGVPCQPEAFAVGERRLALRHGMSSFAKRLSDGLELRLRSPVATLRLGAASPAGSDWTLTLESGEVMSARAVALTMPAPSAIALLERMSPVPRPVEAILPLLALIRMLPCLTVIARYPVGTAPPAWEASFPASSAAIHTILNDSSKRRGEPRLTLVIQARPAFSRSRLEEPEADWTRTLLAEAASLHGDWVARPDLVQSHVWRHARVDSTSPLAAPIALKCDGGATLGLAGDGFHPAGGVEGAWLSGVSLAERFIGMTS